ncbi:MAG: peptidylprolyl isomerase [Pirellulales bacterium]
MRVACLACFVAVGLTTTLRSYSQTGPYGPPLSPPPAVDLPPTTQPVAPPVYPQTPFQPPVPYPVTSEQQPGQYLPPHQVPPGQMPPDQVPPGQSFPNPAFPAPTYPVQDPTSAAQAPYPTTGQPGPALPVQLGFAPPPAQANLLSARFPLNPDRNRSMISRETPGLRSTTISALNDATIKAAPTIASWGEFTDAQIIGRVGGESILAGDVMGTVNRALEQYRDQMSPEEYEEQKLKATKMFLQQLIETKVIFADAMAKIPPENLSKMRDSVNEQFEKNIVGGMMERSKVGSRAELEAKLKSGGSSLDKQSQMFFERSVANQWMKQSVKQVESVPLADILSYYKNHQAEYEYKGKARWEELMVDFTQVSDKPTAYRMIVEMGNAVFGGQAAFADVAKKSSQGPTSYKGGEYDWTTQGSLRSAVLEEAIHNLPVGQLSRILEDETGFHIVRVIERKAAGRVPFEDAQPEIKTKLLEEANKKLEDAYLAKVKTARPGLDAVRRRRKARRDDDRQHPGQAEALITAAG